QAGLIGGPDRAQGRWSAAAAEAALACAAQIRQAAGSVPDLGAVRAAGVLSGRLGLVVTADGIEELARRGLIPVAGHYKGWPLYDGRVLEAFADTAAAVGATRGGRLRTADQSAAYLRIRRSDPGPPDPRRDAEAGQARPRPLGPAGGRQRAAVPDRRP